jgi:hypothetical protein
MTSSTVWENTGKPTERSIKNKFIACIAADVSNDIR